MRIQWLLQCILRRLSQRHVYAAVTATYLAKVTEKTCVSRGHCDVFSSGHCRNMSFRWSLRSAIDRAAHRHVFTRSSAVTLGSSPAWTCRRRCLFKGRCRRSSDGYRGVPCTGCRMGRRVGYYRGHRGSQCSRDPRTGGRRPRRGASRRPVRCADLRVVRGLKGVAVTIVGDAVYMCAHVQRAVYRRRMN